MSDAPTLQHRLDCLAPDVSVQRGVTKLLLTCRNCGASVYVPLSRAIPGDVYTAQDAAQDRAEDDREIARDDYP